MSRPLTHPERKALDRKFPRTDAREVIGNAMLVGTVVMAAIGLACLLIFGGPAR